MTIILWTFFGMVEDLGWPTGTNLKNDWWVVTGSFLLQISVSFLESKIYCWRVQEIHSWTLFFFVAINEAMDMITHKTDVNVFYFVSGILFFCPEVLINDHVILFHFWLLTAVPDLTTCHQFCCVIFSTVFLPRSIWSPEKTVSFWIRPACLEALKRIRYWNRFKNGCAK